jgi:hypothetical protein
MPSIVKIEINGLPHLAIFKNGQLVKTVIDPVYVNECTSNTGGV